MRLVFATVGVVPETGTAPPLTRILPAASRLSVTWSLKPLPKTERIPPASEATMLLGAWAWIALAARALVTWSLATPIPLLTGEADAPNGSRPRSFEFSHNASFG